MTTNHDILGIHHVTAMTSSAEKNYRFFTEVLGMRLVKKTVNQDDIQTYHTFFADDRGNPGTDMTFFDFPNNPQGIKGNNSITRTGFRVPSDKALDYWLERLTEFGVENEGISETFGKQSLRFSDFDQQRYQLFSDEGETGVAPGIPWQNGPVPHEFGIVGLGPVELTVSYQTKMAYWLVDKLGYREVAEAGASKLYEVGEGGNGAQIIVVTDSESPSGQQGYGEVHHLAIRVKDRAALTYWEQILDSEGLRHSGYVDRFYFKSLYVRIGHILFEFATDGPGFMGDEPYETLGESLSLPPFLESQRTYIESAVRPFDTTRKDDK